MEKIDRIVFWTCLFLGFVGAAGQCYLLGHDLINSYPYKMMNEPPAYIYAMAGRSGANGAMTFTIIITLLAARYLIGRPRFIPVLAAVLCPVLYVFSFEVYCGPYTTDRMQVPNFDGYTGETVRHLFTFTAFWLAVWGAGLGFVSGLLVEKAGGLWKRFSVRNTLS